MMTGTRYEKKDLPVSLKQLLYLALLIFFPLAISAAVVVWAPSKPGHGGSDTLLALAIVGAIAAVLIAVLLVAARRHAVEISGEGLVVRHSVYTLALERSEVESAKARAITSLDQLGLSTRKNGIAAFGYFSGWFRGAHGDLTFCALSQWPVYLITFEGSTRTRQLAISANAQLIHEIEAWANA